MSAWLDGWSDGMVALANPQENLIQNQIQTGMNFCDSIPVMKFWKKTKFTLFFKFY